MGKFFEQLVGGYILGKVIDDVKGEKGVAKEERKIDTQILRDNSAYKSMKVEKEYLDQIIVGSYKPEDESVYDNCLLYLDRCMSDEFIDDDELDLIIYIKNEIQKVREYPKSIDRRFVLLEGLLCVYQNNSDLMLKADLYTLAHMQTAYIVNNINQNTITNKVKYNFAKLYDAEVYMLEERYAAALVRYFDFLNWNDLLQDIYRVDYDVKDLKEIYYAVIVNIISIYRIFGFVDKANEIKNIFSNAIESAKRDIFEAELFWHKHDRPGMAHLWNFVSRSFDADVIEELPDELFEEEDLNDVTKMVPIFSLSNIYSFVYDVDEFPKKNRLDDVITDLGDSVCWNVTLGTDSLLTQCHKSQGDYYLFSSGGMELLEGTKYHIPNISSRGKILVNKQERLIISEEERKLIERVPFKKGEEREFNDAFEYNNMLYGLYFMQLQDTTESEEECFTDSFIEYEENVVEEPNTTVQKKQELEKSKNEHQEILSAIESYLHNKYMGLICTDGFGWRDLLNIKSRYQKTTGIQIVDDKEYLEDEFIDFLIVELNKIDKIKRGNIDLNIDPEKSELEKTKETHAEILNAIDRQIQHKYNGIICTDGFGWRDLLNIKSRYQKSTGIQIIDDKEYLEDEFIDFAVSELKKLGKITVNS